MKKLVNVTKISHEEWLEYRLQGIGGSDCGAIMGFNSYKTPYQLYVEKVERIKQPAGEKAYWGNVLENIVAEEFSKRTGKKVRKNNFMLQHDEHKFMVANIDREVIGENAILECKTTSAFNGNDWNGDEVPPSYIFQCMHYMAVTGADKCYIACLVGGQRFVYKEIDRDNDLIEMIIEKEREFWECVQNLTPPPTATASELYPKSNEKTVTLDILEELKQWDDLQVKKKEILTLESELKDKIQSKMQDNEVAICGNRKVTWKSQVSNRLDSKKIKELDEELYNKCIKASYSRVFKVK